MLLPDLLDVIAARLSDLKSEINVEARPVIPPGYIPRQKAKELTEIIEKKRPPVSPSKLGMQNNRGSDDVNIGARNILAVCGDATDEEIDFWRNWYDHAHKDVQKLSQELNVPFKLMALVVAAMSPNSLWHVNLLSAERAVLLAAKSYDDPERLALEEEITPLEEEKRKLDTELKQLEDANRAETDRTRQNTKLTEIRNRQKEIEPLSIEVNQRLKKATTKYTNLAKKHGHRPSAYPKNVRKALNVLFSEDRKKWLTGPKVGPFWAAIVKPRMILRRMVLDGHAINIFDGVKVPLKDARPVPEGSELRRRMLLSYDIAAQKFAETHPGFNTRSMQALTWYVWKFVVNGESVADVVDESDIAEVESEQFTTEAA